MELEALEVVRTEIIKVYDRYKKKAVREREKVDDVYVTVCGEKCYTDSDIYEWYSCDYITSGQADKYTERLKKKKATAGEKHNSFTKSEMVCKIVDNLLYNINVEIHDIKVKEKIEKDKEERWNAAQQQGLSYKQFLELEEVNRQSEEYEKLMGI